RSSRSQEEASSVTSTTASGSSVFRITLDRFLKQAIHAVMKASEIRNNVRHVSSCKAALNQGVDAVAKALKRIEQRGNRGALVLHSLSILGCSAESILAWLLASEFELVHHPG